MEDLKPNVHQLLSCPANTGFPDQHLDRKGTEEFRTDKGVAFEDLSLSDGQRAANMQVGFPASFCQDTFTDDLLLCCCILFMQ